MHVTAAKLAGLTLAVAFAIASVVSQGGLTQRAVQSCVILLIPLGLIWFPDELGAMKGHFGRGRYIDAETPAVLLSILGWFCLIGFGLLFFSK